jgi:hypothetical protein
LCEVGGDIPGLVDGASDLVLSGREVAERGAALLANDEDFELLAFGNKGIRTELDLLGDATVDTTTETTGGKGRGRG